MEALFLNPKFFDSSLDIIETFAKEIFSGKDELQKLKLSERLKNLLNLNSLQRIFTPEVQDMEVDSSRNVELPNELWLKIIQNLPGRDVIHLRWMKRTYFAKIFWLDAV